MFIIDRRIGLVNCFRTESVPAAVRKASRRQACNPRQGMVE